MNRRHPTGKEQSSPAFTLLEVIMALTILSLLATSVYGMLWQAGNAAVEIRDFDHRDEQVSRFIGMLRRTVESMPQGGAIKMVPPAESPTGFYEMTITDASTAFAFGENPATNIATTIGMRLQPDKETETLGRFGQIDEPLYQVSISREDFAPGDADGDGMAFRSGGDESMLVADEQGRYWLPLLNHVTGMNWRFWDETRRDWLTEWTDSSRLPQMVELSLTDVYRSAPIRVVFDIPDHLTQAQGQSPAAAAGGESEDTEPQGGTSSGAPSQARPQPPVDGARPQPGQGRPGGDARGRIQGRGFRRGPGGGQAPGGGGAVPSGNPGGGGR